MTLAGKPSLLYDSSYNLAANLDMAYGLVGFGFSSSFTESRKAHKFLMNLFEEIV